MEKINTIIQKFRHGSYRWSAVKRIYIPKKDGKQRPVGIPVWSDRLAQEVMRSILEAYYEPQFSDLSHGFRTNRGCHSALKAVLTWKNIEWFIEGDIKECFDSIDHRILLAILKEKIYDARFTKSVSLLLEAGYVEYGNHKPALKGTPQGGTLSPILANIYLDKLDKFVENNLVSRYTRTGFQTDVTTTPNTDVPAPGKKGNFRCLHYVRYADDFLLGFAGSKQEAEEIKGLLTKFLQSRLKLDLSKEKTLVTHAYLDSPRFLGYEIERILEENTRNPNTGAREFKLGVSAKAVKERCELYKRSGKTVPVFELINLGDYKIVSLFHQRFSGCVQYYRFAHNVHVLDELRRVMEKSLLQTLAEKHRVRINRLGKPCPKKIRTPIDFFTFYSIPGSPVGELHALRLDTIPLKPDNLFATERKYRDIFEKRHNPELVIRLLTNQCEICFSSGRVEVHHARKFADIEKDRATPEPKWKREMLARKRKTLVVCKTCHGAIHSGRVRTTPSKKTLPGRELSKY